MGRNDQRWDDLDPQSINSYMPRDEAYIPLLSLEFAWDKKDVLQFDQLWESGMSVEVMATHFHRDPDEILVLAIDRARLRKIHPRKGGILGEDNPQRYKRGGGNHGKAGFPVGGKPN